MKQTLIEERVDIVCGNNKDETLKNFMLEFFDFYSLKKAGFYGKEIKKSDYKAQAKKVCEFFGLKTVYEYGAIEFRAHLTFTGERPKNEPMVIEYKNIYK